MSRIVFWTKSGREVDFETSERRGGVRVPDEGRPLPAFSPVGTKVALFKDNGEVLHTTTRSLGGILGGSPVIWVEGVPSCYAVERVRVDVDPSVTRWPFP